MEAASPCEDVIGDLASCLPNGLCDSSTLSPVINLGDTDVGTPGSLPSCLSNQVTAPPPPFFLQSSFRANKDQRTDVEAVRVQLPAQTRQDSGFQKKCRRGRRVFFAGLSSLLHLYLQLCDAYEYRYLELLESPFCLCAWAIAHCLKGNS